MSGITEKTVELNVTAELLSYLRGIFNTTAVATGPTLRAEAKLGYDVHIDIAGRPFFIQFKRAYRTGFNYRFHINRTKYRDQHARLLALESLGVAVWYCFPLFDNLVELRNNRYRLLTSSNTTWHRPSWLTFSPDHHGHHSVCVDKLRMTVHTESKPVLQHGPFSFQDALIDMLAKEDFGRSEWSDEDTNRVLKALNDPQIRESLEAVGMTELMSDEYEKPEWIKDDEEGDDPPFGMGFAAISLVD